MRSLLTIFTTTIIAAVTTFQTGAWAQEDVFVHERPDGQISEVELAENSYKVRVPLAAVRSQSGSIRLLGVDAVDVLSVEIAPQANIESARLVLRHASSYAMREADPHLRLDVNGQFATQLPASTTNNAAVDQITINPALLKAGFNTFRVEAKQRYTYECQDPTAAELWTDIDTQLSYLELTYSRREFNGTIADLDDFVSAGVGGIDDVTIVTPANVSDEHLKWGTLLSQTIANRLGYRMPSLKHAALGDLTQVENSDLSGDLVIVGTFDEINAKTGWDLSPSEEAGGEIILRSAPQNSTRFALIATGRTAEEVELAVESLIATEFPFAAVDQLSVLKEDVPLGFKADARLSLEDGVSYKFSDLKFKTHTSIGQQSAWIPLEFELSSDWFPHEEEQVKLSLDFAYGAGLEPGSVINIHVNDVFRNAIALTNPNGEAAPGYNVFLPVSAFRPGSNRIVFEAQLDDEQVGACSSRNMRNLAFVLEDTSILHLPEASQYVELPNLGLMKETGYPYSGADQSDFSLIAASKTSENIAATWTVAARLGQVKATDYRNVDVTFGGEIPKQNALIVGSRHQLDNVFKIQNRLNIASGEDNFVRRVSLSALGSSGLVVQGVNPVFKNGLVTIVTAENDASLLKSVRNLVAHSHWGQLDGELAVWRKKADTFAVELPQATFFVGDLEPKDKAAFHNAREPWKWVGYLFVILLAIAFVLTGVTTYIRRRVRGGG